MKCDKCKEQEARIIIDGSIHYCLDCYNGLMAESLGIEHTNEFIRQLTVIDVTGRQHTFEVSRHIMPQYSNWEAQEKDGYSFSLMVSNDLDQATGLQKLYDRVLDALSYKSLEEIEGSNFVSNAYSIDGKQYSIKSIGTGTVSCNPNNDERGLMMDGKFIPFGTFGKMASAYEGFKMIYQIEDATEEPLTDRKALRKVDISLDAVLRRFDRYLGWLLDDEVLPTENEKDFKQVMEECIYDLNLMILAGFREECIEAAKHMLASMEKIKSRNPELINHLLDGIDRETWFLF